MAEGRQRRIAVTGGGTAGHIFPALDFLRAYRRDFGAEGHFIGCEPGLETTLVPAHGERLELVPGLPWARQGLAGRIRAVACLPGAIRAAREVLRRDGIELVIGSGGYSSVSTCLAAWTLRIPFVLHEANARPGWANRLLGRFARLACIGFEETAAHFACPVVVTGVPAGTVRLSQGGEARQLVVLGGSEGSPLLDREAPRLLAELRRRKVSFSVRHLTPGGDVAALARKYAEAGIPAQVEGFVSDIEAVYEGATMAITSAGTRTLAELSAAAVPALIAPLPGAARGHQAENAHLYAARTGALVVEDEEWDVASLAMTLATLLEDVGELERRRRGAAQWAHPNAARDVVRECERILRG